MSPAEQVEIENGDSSRAQSGVKSSVGFLKATGIKVGYGDVTAVWGVDIAAVPGRLTVVLGRNGAGKTSLLRGIAGLLTLTAGTVELDGRNITRLPAWRRANAGIGFVQEGKRVFGQLTVHENLLLGLPRGAKSKPNESVEEIYEEFPRLAAMRAKAAGELSGGQQQMLAVASAIAAEPAVLLVDEPSSGLSPVAFDEILSVIASFKSRGLAVILVEQLVERVLDGVADHAVILERGRVVFDGAADQLDPHQVAADFLV